MSHGDAGAIGDVMTDDKELLTHQLEAILSICKSLKSWEEYVDDNPLWLHVNRAIERARDLMPINEDA